MPAPAGEPAIFASANANGKSAKRRSLTIRWNSSIPADSSALASPARVPMATASAISGWAASPSPRRMRSAARHIGTYHAKVASPSRPESAA